MGTWVYDLLFCSGLVLLALACFQSERNWVRRTGLWLIFASIGMGVWFLTHSIALMLGAVAAWFIVPVGQAMYFSRKLRFSRQRQLNPGRLDPVEFEDLGSLTTDLRNVDFVMDADYRLEPSPIEQGFRLFRHRSELLYAAIAIVHQGPMSLYYAMILTPGAEGAIWMTWDYPLAYGLKMPPHFKIYRCLDARSAEELLAQHREFLKINEVVPSPDAPVQEAGHFFDDLFKATIQHNLNIGLLQQFKNSEDEVAYSWRGTFFISWQVLVELIRG
ncbi:MAG: hypothetical protein PHD76_01750 [Methylacidiphilales bacterium]|nr:hypothetical protein [Candidatus Methylacidiphilales bacterium]